MKKISVKVKAGAKQEKIDPPSRGSGEARKEYVVWVRERAQEGKANEAVIEALAEYFGVSKSAVSIVSGHTSKTKIIEIS